MGPKDQFITFRDLEKLEHPIIVPLKSKKAGRFEKHLCFARSRFV